MSDPSIFSIVSTPPLVTPLRTAVFVPLHPLRVYTSLPTPHEGWPAGEYRYLASDGWTQPLLWSHEMLVSLDHFLPCWLTPRVSSATTSTCKAPAICLPRRLSYTGIERLLPLVSSSITYLPRHPPSTLYSTALSIAFWLNPFPRLGVVDYSTHFNAPRRARYRYCMSPLPPDILFWLITLALTVVWTYSHFSHSTLAT